MILDPKEDKLTQEHKRLNEQKLNYNMEAREAKRDNNPVLAAAKEKQCEIYTAKRDIVKFELDIYKEGLKEPPNGPNQQLIGQWQDEIKDLKEKLDGLEDTEAREVEQAEEVQEAEVPTSPEEKKNV
jgi:hypothetical protein